MTRASDPPVDGDRLESSLDAELGRILEAYLADLEAGRPVDPERLLAEHPSLAGPLRSCLAVVNLADRVADGAGGGPAARSGAMVAAMSMPMAPGVLSTWDRRDGPPPRVHLHDLADDEPLVRPGFPAMPPLPEGSWGRYQLQGEIARGGMGAVLKGRDADLGRDLAIKVLLESHRGSPEIVRRFIEEAQIGGQLQHPGIVPVYELGTCADRRPYFAMKLVKGRTLASMLQARTEPRQDLPRFLSIFEQIGQTMAYAHARGVIHRDLKPTNVMVGSFGEVQVMDWGLAKVLARGGVAEEAGAEPLAETVIMTVRSGPAGSGSESQAGSVLGTPAYMAPEQARGDVARLDERVDVFGLGAILCEVLTGRPPFTGTTREEIRDRSARGDLAGAMGRLDACGADAELVALAEDCPAAEPERRPRDASEVSRRMTAYQAGVQDRLRAAELARVEAQTRAEEERKRAAIERSRRRRTVALAGALDDWAVVRGTLLGDEEGAQRLTDAARLADRDPWRNQLRAVRWFAPLAQPLESLRGLSKSARIDALPAVSIEMLGGRLLDLGDPMKAIAILREGQLLHPGDVWLNYTLGTCLVRLGRTEEAIRYYNAARSIRPETAHEMAHALETKGETDQAIAVFQDLTRLRPKDGSHFTCLGAALLARGRTREARAAFDTAIEVSRARIAIKPDDSLAYSLLAKALHHQERLDDAIAAYREALRLKPDAVLAHSNLGVALMQQGKVADAIVEFREELRLGPEKVEVRGNLGIALMQQDKLDDAIAEFREVLRLRPDSAENHTNLGRVLLDQGKLDDAIAEFREAGRLKPDLPQAHFNLGEALKERGDLDEAIAEYREVLRLKPDYPGAGINLGLALRSRRDFAGAIAAFRKARDLAKADPQLAQRAGLELATTEQFASLAPRLPAILAGQLRPADAAETLGFARLRQEGKQHGASARFWEETFRSRPELADEMRAGHRYNAACAAALAGCGRGKDDPPPDEAARARWRKQAIDWLEADLAAWSNILRSGPPQARPFVAQMLQHWKADADLAGLREPAARDKLPDEERKACRALWVEVDALLKQAGETKQ